MKIPIFDGDARKWPNFKDEFKVLVIDQGLQPVEKLMRLKEALVGEPRRDVEAKVLSGASFDDCWRHLEDYFENERVIISGLMKGLFSLEKIDSSKPGTIRHFLCGIKNGTENLRARGVDLESWDPVWNELVIARMDSALRQEFESSLENNKNVPSLAEIESFWIRVYCDSTYYT